jgi:hypothetical protein
LNRVKKIKFNAGLIILWSVFSGLIAFGQFPHGLEVLQNTDSSFVRKFKLKNDVRFFYGLQGNNLSIGSMREERTNLNSDIYRNTNDYIGAGLSYGWIDGDVSFSLPGTTYLKQERANLKQLKMAFGYSRRKIVFRLYLVENKGMVVSSSGNDFETAPTLHERRLALQVIYIVDSKKYSYRASRYQSEYQLKTAGSILLKLEPFYRKLGTEEGTVIPEAYDVSSRFGEHTGLQYLKAPGLLFMPGYGINIVVPGTRYFISPIIYAGAGFAYNIYGAKNGAGNFTNAEYAANFHLNAGYNGPSSYVTLMVASSVGYAAINPAYFTSANITFMITYGIRFLQVR